jgi:hypothetical protein
MTRLALPRGRLSFANLFTPVLGEDSNPGDTRVWDAKIILEADDALYSTQIKACNDAMKAAALLKWQDKGDSILAELREKGRTFLKDGNDKSKYDGYAGNKYVAMRRRETNSKGEPNTPPKVFRDIPGAGRVQLSASDGKIYSGCYVYSLGEVYAQDNKFGKRINCEFVGVRFVADGEPFGAMTVNADDFGSYGDDDFGYSDLA